MVQLENAIEHGCSKDPVPVALRETLFWSKRLSFRDKRRNVFPGKALLFFLMGL